MRRTSKIKLPPVPPALPDQQLDALVEQIVFGDGEEHCCNALLVLLEEIMIAGGLALDLDRVLHITTNAQVKAFSLCPLEMEARINKIRARLVRPTRTKPRKTSRSQR